MENGWNQVEALYACKCDQRAGVRDDWHSKILESVELPLQLTAVQLKVRNAFSRSVLDEFLALLSEQLRRASAGHFALPVELEDDQFARGLLRGSVELLEEVDEVAIDFDGRCVHTSLRDRLYNPVSHRNGQAPPA